MNISLNFITVLAKDEPAQKLDIIIKPIPPPSSLTPEFEGRAR